MSDSKIARAEQKVLFDFFEKYKARPSVPGVDWARENWYNLQSIVDRVVALRQVSGVRSGKGKAVVCAVLGASLAAAVEARDRRLTAESQLTESLQNLARSLQGQVAELKEQLKAEKNEVKRLQTALKERLLADAVREEFPPRSEIGYPLYHLQAVRE